MSDAFDLSASVIKEEVDPEPWGVVQEGGDEECAMPQQRATLAAVKHEIDIEEHDLLQHPRVRALLSSRPHLRLQEISTTAQLTPMDEANSIKLEKESKLTTSLLSSAVVLRDCAAELQQGGRYCQVCRVQFPSRSALADHASSAHVQSGGKTAPYKVKVALNVKRNYTDSLGIHESNQCKYTYTPRSRKPFKCDQCKYRCNRKSSLNRHLLTHSGEKPFRCDQCEYGCNYNTSLKRHLLTHSGEKLFRCDQCKYTCNQRQYFKIHLLWHSGKKLFECDQCDYGSNSIHHFKKHLLTHSGEKPFKCDQCKYRCTQKSNLKRHLRTHSGEKLFRCDHCEYGCNIKKYLKIHLLTHAHSGEKPFKCDQCEYRCSYKSNLKRHLLTHSEEKLFKCDQCEYRCNRKCYLKIHLCTHSG